jgi:hypothetical protein
MQPVMLKCSQIDIFPSSPFYCLPTTFLCLYVSASNFYSAFLASYQCMVMYDYNVAYVSHMG